MIFFACNTRRIYSTLLVISECGTARRDREFIYFKTHLGAAAEPAATLSSSEILEWEERPWLLACGRIRSHLIVTRISAGISFTRPIRPNMSPNVLIVCLGNICRSPMGEAVLRHIAKERNIDLTVDSAGTAAYHIGEEPDNRSVL